MPCRPGLLGKRSCGVSAPLLAQPSNVSSKGNSRLGVSGSDWQSDEEGGAWDGGLVVEGSRGAWSGSREENGVSCREPVGHQQAALQEGTWEGQDALTGKVGRQPLPVQFLGAQKPKAHNLGKPCPAL